MTNTSNNPFVEYPESDYIPYAMIESYSQEWTQRDIFRELKSNAMDAGNDRVILKDNVLTIIDDGSKLPNGILPVHFLLGKNQKADSNAIGQFGEGLKLAMRLSLKYGLTVNVDSVWFTYHAESTETFGEKTMRVKFSKKHEKTHPGTIITINNWEFSDYSSDFLAKSDYLFKCEAGGIVKKSPNNPQLFVKGVFVQNNPGYGLSYDLNHASMVKGRNQLSEHDVKTGIYRVMSECNNADIWEKYIQSVLDEKAEYNVTFYYKPDYEICQVIKKSYSKIFGNKIIGTTYSAMKSAEHLGFKCIEANKLGSLASLFKAVGIETDSDAYARKMGRNYDIITSHNIDDTQKENLGYLRKLARKIGFDAKKIKVMGFQGVGDAASGLCDYANDIVLVRIDQLDKLQDAVNVFIHEVAHYNTHASDLTDIHVNEITRLSGMIIASYMNHKI